LRTDQTISEAETNIRRRDEAKSNNDGELQGNETGSNRHDTVGLGNYPKAAELKKKETDNDSENLDATQQLSELRKKFADEIKSAVEGKTNMSSQAIREILEAIGSLSPNEFKKLYTELSDVIPKGAGDNSINESMTKVKEFFENQSNWREGRMGSVLTELGVNPDVWDKNMNYYIKEDDNFNKWYTNWQQQLLEKVFPLEKISEEKKEEIKKVYKKERGN